MQDVNPTKVSGDGKLSVRTEYEWASGDHAHNHQFLMPHLIQILGKGNGKSMIDLGCGNGSLTAVFADRGYEIVGVDVAGTGIKHAQTTRPDLDFRAHDISGPLPQDLRQQFDVALSIEVIEHLYLPRELFRRADESLVPGGSLVISTPYHGYLKNLALAATNKLDSHWGPAWDYGHIKFFSRATLTSLAAECGYRLESFHRAGRIPSLAMSMIGVFRKNS
jgi:2-polyprenyl-6-hydroxyphenyl methylase/3-demethylubiquinone-9 3-methyltransferase